MVECDAAVLDAWLSADTDPDTFKAAGRAWWLARSLRLDTVPKDCEE